MHGVVIGTENQFPPLRRSYLSKGLPRYKLLCLKYYLSYKIIPFFVYQDAVREFTLELNQFILDPALSQDKLSFNINRFTKGPGNVLIIKGSLVVKQSHASNEKSVKDKIRSETIKYFEYGENPKTL